MKTKMGEMEEIKRGQEIIKVLNLKVKANGRVDTEWGDKTPLGLFRTVYRLVHAEESI